MTRSATAVRNSNRKNRKVPRPRRELDSTSADIRVRFAIRLRTLLDAKQIAPDELAQAMTESGVATSHIAVRKWLGAERFPSPIYIEAMAPLLGLDDYRQVLPEPLKRRRKRS